MNVYRDAYEKLLSQHLKESAKYLKVLEEITILKDCIESAGYEEREVLATLDGIIEVWAKDDDEL